MISTAFRRRILDAVASFDCSIRNKTVFDTIGDSANLLISKLVTGDNRIIIPERLSAIGRLFYIGDTTYSPINWKRIKPRGAFLASTAR